MQIEGNKISQIGEELRFSVQITNIVSNQFETHSTETDTLLLGKGAWEGEFTIIA